MKKMIALVLTLALTLGLSASALAYSDKNLEAPKAKDVVIDGDLGEWDTSKCLRIDNVNQITDQIEHWALILFAACLEWQNTVTSSA